MSSYSRQLFEKILFWVLCNLLTHPQPVELSSHHTQWCLCKYWRQQQPECSQQCLCHQHQQVHIVSKYKITPEGLATIGGTISMDVAAIVHQFSLLVMIDKPKLWLRYKKPVSHLNIILLYTSYVILWSISHMFAIIMLDQFQQQSYSSCTYT